MKKVRYSFIIMGIVVLFPGILLATGQSQGTEMVHRMTNLVFQLAIIIFAARAGGLLFEKIGLPSVLGELAAGIIIGPYLLGGISLPGFEQGFFPLPGSVLPISPELYGIAVIASIILLFMAGLETDIELFIRYSITGSVVGIGGIVFAYLIGSLTGMFFFDLSFMDPKCMFLGVMSTTTSVGISARILSERRSMDSPEGVTILSGAVIDDVLGIILLAIVLGISLMMPGGGNGGGTVAWGNIGLIALKAFGVWLGFTAAGFFLAHYVSSFLKLFKNRFVFSILAFGLALFLAGIFEKAGLAMIIGAYVMGISLSKTDICDVLQDTLQPIEVFFVPVFFTVMGMMVDVKTFASLETILFGLLYAAGAIFAKVIGCGGPSLFLGFNRLGAARIGFGMAPRGEVALIIGGIGLSYGILNEQLFGGLIMMMLISAIVVPPVLDRLLKKREKGTTREPKRGEIITTSYSLPSQEHSELLVSYIVEYFKKKGFFVNTMKLDTVIYQVRKDDIFIKFFYHPVQVIFKTTERDVPIVKTIVDESFLRLYDTINALQALAPRDLRRHIASATECRRDIDIVNILSPVSIIMNLQSGTKEGAIKELVEVLEANGKLLNKKKILKEVLARERIMSTGMEDGLAIPHARSNGVASVCMALGIHRAGIDFESFDEKPSHIIMLFVSSMSEKDPHLYLLSEIAIFVNSEETKNTLLGLKTVKEVHDFFRER